MQLNENYSYFVTHVLVTHCVATQAIMFQGYNLKIIQTVSQPHSSDPIKGKKEK